MLHQSQQCQHGKSADISSRRIVPGHRYIETVGVYGVMMKSLFFFVYWVIEVKQYDDACLIANVLFLESWQHSSYGAQWACDCGYKIVMVLQMSH